MTLKTFNVADANLLSGSNELIRQALMGYFVNEDTGFREQEVAINSEIVEIESNFAETNASVDEFSLINSIRFATRLHGANNEEIIRSDEEWKNYVIGGTFGGVTYPGVYNDNVYFDHRAEIELPLYQYELNNSFLILITIYQSLAINTHRLENILTWIILIMCFLMN